MFGGKKVIAVLPAAGSGTRMKLQHSKLLCKIQGQEILLKSVSALSFSNYFDQIIIPCRQNDLEVFTKLLSVIKTPQIKLIEGGLQRQDSVRNALDFISAGADSLDQTLVFIHDAARCFISHDLIERCLLAALEHGAVTAAVDCVDTVYAADDKDRLVLPLLDRKTIRAIQTPQVFNFNLLLQAHKAYSGSASTDDSGMVAQIAPVYCVPGERSNIKVTTTEDLAG